MNELHCVDKIETLDKNRINVSVYKIDDGLLYAYTALWCTPCKRIKPKLIEIMSKHCYPVIMEETIEKSIFKKEINDFVPFFVVKKDNVSENDSIQTSDEILFNQFLSKNGIKKMILDDDF